MIRRRVHSTKTALLGALALSLSAAHALAQAWPQDAPPKRVVSEDEMTRYLAALDELIEIGEESKLQNDPRKPSRDLSEPMVRAIEEQGFDVRAFSEVHWNMMMGYLTYELKEKQPELDALRQKQEADLEKMRQYMTPEQFEETKKHQLPLAGLLAFYQDVPPENVMLAGRHKAQLEKVLKRKPKPR
jgi:hypothetical protein